eukprot:5366366-Prymnesium_polylepis.1
MPSRTGNAAAAPRHALRSRLAAPCPAPQAARGAAPAGVPTSSCGRAAACTLAQGLAKAGGLRAVARPCGPIVAARRPDRPRRRRDRSTTAVAGHSG